MVEFTAYSCSKCGNPFPAVRPDDKHTIALISPCPKGDSIPIPHECNNCHEINTKHWDVKHDKFEDDFNRMSNVKP